MWIKGEPRRAGIKKLRYRCQGEKIRQGSFYWPNNNIENAWIEIGDRDGIALYPDEGYEIVSYWKAPAAK